jgi:UDP-3-O-[3-hydroxymyristoyl] glucosamine N-acyltransferase
VTFTLAELAARVGGEVVGEGGVAIGRVAALEEAGPGDVSFFANKKYRAAFEACRASAVVVEPEEDVPAGRTVLRARNAYLAFAKISTLFRPPPQAVPGVAEQAHVDPTARVDPSAELMPFVYVGPRAVIGARCILHPGVHVGAGARLGEDCLLWPNAVVREGCLLGSRVILQPGCIVGSDGFGFAFDPDGEGDTGPRHYKVPQIGNTVIEDDVELGANVCVDRATLGSTVVRRGVKVDNLVQIAHNVQVGPLSILVAQVGIAGSTKLGAGVVAAGQVGIVGHVNIGDGAKLGAQCGIMSDVEPGATLMGSPAMDKGEYLRAQAGVKRVPELMKKVRELEKKLEKLEEKP